MPDTYTHRLALQMALVVYASPDLVRWFKWNYTWRGWELTVAWIRGA